jgi:hypothetical protein
VPVKRFTCRTETRHFVMAITPTDGCCHARACGVARHRSAGSAAAMNAASSDWAAQLIARSLREIAVALVEEVEEAQQHIVRAGELLRPRP